MSQPLILRVLASCVSAANGAGKIVRDVMSGGNLGIVDKGENDLQTEADRSAQRCIISSLTQLFPNIAIVGEEERTSVDEIVPSFGTDLDSQVLALKCPADLSNVAENEICVWVDPLDGTSEYTQGLLDHVTVLIGVAVGKEPVAGVIHQPFYNYKSGKDLGRTVWGLRGAGVWGITKATPSEGRIITTTRSHSTGLVDQVLQACQPTEVLRVGGAGHKVMLLIEGKAHAYVFASAGCKRWDTCAPEAILRELGGELTDMHGDKYEYNKETIPLNARGVLGTALADDHATFLANVRPVVAGKLQ